MLICMSGLFADAVRCTHKNATNQEIWKYIGFALASAVDRDGGRKSRNIAD